MAQRRLIQSTLKVCVLAAAIFGVWRLSHAPPAPMQTEEDDPEEKTEEAQVAIRISHVTRATVHEYVTGYGAVEAAPAGGGARISPAVGGVVEAVRCKEGQYVEKGEVLFTLDGRAVEADIERAQKVLASNQGDFDRVTKGATTAPAWRVSTAEQLRDMAKADLDRAVARQAMLTVVSPLAGRVETITVQAGEWADPTVMAVEVVDRLVVAAAIVPEELAGIQVGQKAIIQLADGKEVESQVTLVDTRLDARTGQGSVDVAIPKEAGLRLGGFARVRIVTKEETRLTVPAESVVRDADGKSAVQAVEIDGRYAALLPVMVGIRDGDVVEVSGEGLHEGQSVATTGAYALLQGKTPVRVVGH
ncbi:MAG TPA: efflux RND transporter periplasmic adaptor subunit [Tepidisphaeraceae bacterium]|jgi:membrane fusion protein (multidrug efflux system)|nr:efflux RND transporter periplasmic adaptor subunit [Tepidisphaeraceae bacterium]